ncbi:hypothetical protein POTOM_023241 [Populus tomentosa]|uniref:RING-type domain-containing protein n=1 Tax=Populus tomentosa TaxID=118781 RepID=A0A8X8CYV3_POPTO|nr:hypothetical protein POTOM_023241 [Populus tomentosa]
MAEPYITDEQDYDAMQLLEIGLELSESEYSEEDEDFIPVVELDSSPRFLLNSDQATTTTAAAAAENINFQEEEVDVEEERNKRRRVEKLGSGGDICCRNGGDDAGGESSQNSQWNRSEFDGLFCPICMEAWTNKGDHHICCLPCGHLFGLSCIEKWLRQRGRLAKCPQCNRKGTLRDIRKLFVPRIAVVDEESQKRIRFLEEKCASLVTKDVDLCKKESEWKRREAALQLEVQKCKERTIYLEHLLGDLQRRPSGLATAYRGSQGHEFGKHLFTFNIHMFHALLEIASTLISTGRDLQAASCYRFVAMISMLVPMVHLIESLARQSKLPVEGSFRELRVDGARLFDVDASGKILLLVRRVPMMGGSHVLTKAAAWSCSWDLNCSHYVYAGLQNGSLLVFDMRITGSPVESRLGHTTDPIHTVQSLQHISTLPSGVKTVVSASSVGMCQWNFGCEEERVEMSNEVVSQTLFKPSPATGQGVLGSHLHLKRVGSNYEKLGIACSTVSGIRLPKSSIIDRQNQKPLFATGDEVSCGLILQELPSFTATQRLKPHQHFIYDVKYTSTHSQGLLGCLSEDTVQLFSTKLSSELLRRRSALVFRSSVQLKSDINFVM